MEKISSECGLRTCMGAPGFGHVCVVRARANGRDGNDGRQEHARGIAVFRVKAARD